MHYSALPPPTHILFKSSGTAMYDYIQAYLVKIIYECLRQLGWSQGNTTNFLFFTFIGAFATKVYDKLC
jgi:hypothetical protein